MGHNRVIRESISYLLFVVTLELAQKLRQI